MNSWMHVAGWVLVHFVWQGAAIAITAAVMLHVCRRRSASARYLIACGALATMLVSSASTAALIDGDASVGATPGVPVDTRLVTRIDVMLSIAVAGPPPSAVTNAYRIELLLPWIVLAWLCGVVLLLGRTAIGLWHVRCLHALAWSSTESGWQRIGNRLASQLGLARVIRIVELAHVDVPLVVGCLRPIVVLPIAALSSLTAAQVEAILAHELAHIRRHDYLVNLMQTVAETLLFYHPAVWWVSGRIRDEREHCCDAVAVAVCGNPVEYAAALAELEVWRGGDLNLAAAATDGSLLNRVRRILRADVADDFRSSPWTVVLVVAVMTGLTLHTLAQTPSPDSNPKFEVASVRPNASGDNKMSSQILPGGRYTAINIPLRSLIINSYRLQPQQLVGSPDWISAERFDIVAKAAEEFDPPVSSDAPSRVQLMIRGLLEERFKLKVHREPKEVDIYTLVIARADGKLGPELIPSTTDCKALKAARGKSSAPPEPPTPGERPQCGARVLAGELLAGGQPLLELVSLLSGTVGRSIVDRTGLKGAYDISLKWTPDLVRQRAAATTPGETIRINGVEFDPNGPSIFTALQEQLGLKLESGRGTVEALVIDHIERPAPD